MDDLTIALKEEIGNPDLFSGRKAELADFLKWCDLSKRQLSKSRAILARRKKGKTALMQRLYNILYSKNDPMVVPFFIRIKEQPLQRDNFGMLYYQTFLSQYFGFKLRDPQLVNDMVSFQKLKELAHDDAEILWDIENLEENLQMAPALMWDYARDAPHRIAAKKDIRVIVMIDEYQYLNRFIFSDAALQMKENVCRSFTAAAESKMAPMIVTGSFRECRNSIPFRRFERELLKNLDDVEATELVYNYANQLKIPTGIDNASYIARLGQNDPFYIAQLFRTKMPDLNLTTKKGVSAALQFETTPEIGNISKLWQDHIRTAMTSANKNEVKQIIHNLAKYGAQDRTRKQISEEIDSNLSDEELEDCLESLLSTNLILKGPSSIRYKSLGDPIFELVFKRSTEEGSRSPHQLAAS